MGQALARDLETFRQQRSGELLEGFLSAVPEEVHNANNFHFQPCHTFNCAEVVFQTLPDAQDIASWATKEARQSNLKTGLLRDWAQKCSTVTEEAASQAAPPAGQKSLCLKYGQCVCVFGERETRPAMQESPLASHEATLSTQ